MSRQRMNAPLPTREAIYTIEQLEAYSGLTVTVWYTIAGVPEVRTGVSMGPELAFGTSATQGKIRKPENDVLVLQDPHRTTNAVPNRAEKVGPWSQPKGVPAPEGHAIVADPSGNRYLYRNVWDDGQQPKPVEYRIPIARITKISRQEQAEWDDLVNATPLTEAEKKSLTDWFDEEQNAGGVAA